MKQKDIALIVVVSLVTIVISFMLGDMLLGNPGDDVTVLEYLEPISSDLVEPSSDHFNSYISNPTVEVVVGDCKPGQKLSEDGTTCVDLTEDEKHTLQGE